MSKENNKDKKKSVNYRLFIETPICYFDELLSLNGKKRKKGEQKEKK